MIDGTVFEIAVIMEMGRIYEKIISNMYDGCDGI